MSVRVLGIDYSGTLTQRDRDGTHLRCRPSGAHVARQLAQHYDVAMDGFAERFDQVQSSWGEARTTLPRLLDDVLAMAGIDGIDTTALADALVDEVGDHPIDPDAAAAVRTLQSWGLHCVVTSNTTRTTRQRGAALAAAGVEVPLWLSGEVGHAKPDAPYYKELFTTLRITPREFCGIGDFPRTDIAGAVMVGSHAVLVDTWPASQQRATHARNLGALVIPSLAELPAYLWPQGPSPHGRWELLPEPLTGH